METLSEVENKDYLLKIQEDKIKKLEKKITGYERFLLIAVFTIFPIAIMGLYFMTTLATWDNIKFFLIVIPIIAVVLLALALFGWLSEKIKNKI